MMVFLNKIEILYDPGVDESGESFEIRRQTGFPTIQQTSNLVAYTEGKVQTLGMHLLNVGDLSII